MRYTLPEQICSLDIETERTNFKHPESSKLIFAGLRAYSLHKGRYYPRKHLVFFPAQLKELELFLKRFQGIIIGHNILQFDYRVLRPLLFLDGVIEKSVDTLAFLYNKKNDFCGLSLGNLAQLNLGKSKTLDGKSISDYWHRGKRKAVVEYNNNDCILAKGIWWWLLSERYIDASYFDYKRYKVINKIFTVSIRDCEQLTGKKPLFNFKNWTKKIERDGYVLDQKERRIYLDINWFDMSDSVPFDKCPKCKSPKLRKLNLPRNSESENHMTEGQLAEYMAGTWGTVYCLTCGYLEDYEI